jgi:hypothetical protein
MFRKRAAEILRRRLKSLDELDKAEASKSLVPRKDPSIPLTDFFDQPVNPVLLEACASFNPSDPFWSDLGFSGVATSRNPLVAPG